MGSHLSKITTHTGDDDTIGLGDDSRTAKGGLRIAAIGNVDELNSHIGMLLTETLPDGVRTVLTATQHDPFDLGGELCIPGCTMVTIAYVLWLGQWLTDYNADLSQLTEFILSDGSRAAAQAHARRAVARRAEHSIVALGCAETIDEMSHRYIDRLPDLLSVLACVLNRADNGTGILWKCDKRRPA